MRLQQISKAVRAKKAGLRVEKLLEIVLLTCELNRAAAELSRADLSEVLLCDAQTVRRAIKKAQALGFLIVTPIEFDNGGRGANTFQINWDGIAAVLSEGATANG